MHLAGVQRPCSGGSAGLHRSVDFHQGADWDRDKSIFHYLRSICPSVQVGNWLLGY